MEDRLRVVLVDDEQVVCERLKSAPEKHGYAAEIRAIVLRVAEASGRDQARPQPE